MSRPVVPFVGGSLNGTEREAVGISFERPILDDVYLAEWDEWWREWGMDYTIRVSVSGLRGPFEVPPPWPSLPREVYKYELVDGERVRAVFAGVVR